MALDVANSWENKVLHKASVMHSLSLFSPPKSRLQLDANAHSGQHLVMHELRMLNGASYISANEIASSFSKE